MEDALFWSGRRVVVPGGAGLIGSYLVEQLLEQGAQVKVIDDLSNGYLERLSAVSSDIELVQADLGDLDSTIKLFRHAELVMNMAGVAPGLSPEQNKHALLEAANLRVGRAVLQGAIAAGVPRVLVVSSSCVYPDDAPVPTPELPLASGQPEAVNRGYGLAKRMLEAEAVAAAQQHSSLEIAIARPFNVLGARDIKGGAGAHVIPSLLERIFSNVPEIRVWGSGRQTRSFIHAQDLCAAFLGLTQSYACADPVNVGSSEEVSMAALVQKLLQYSGVHKDVIFDLSKPEGALRKAADISKLERILPSYQQEWTLDSALREMVTAKKLQM
jgi:nucleoside-diphosphate-sugar epimerase